MTLIVGMWCAAISAAQAPAATQAQPRFDVTSVKPCSPRDVVGTDGGTSAPGRVAFNCQTLVDYVRQAYALWDGIPSGPVNIVGGPAWANRDRYKITAKSAQPQPIGTTDGPMMQALLEDRFHLRIHRETRQVLIYVLGVTKAGLRLPPAKVACVTDYAGVAPFKKGQTLPPLCGMGTMNKDGIQVHGSTVAQLGIALSHVPLRMERRKFMDKTGIAGRFDFDLKLPPYDLGADGNAPGTPQTPNRPPDDFVRLQDALLNIGLQLTSAKGPDEFLVIDGAERPAAN